MTILSAIQNVGAEAGYNVDDEAIESNDVTTKQLLGIAQRVIREMQDAYPWPVLFKRHSFSLVNGTSTYALPSDFSHYHYDTWWNSSDGWRVIGPMTPQEYASYDGYGVTTTVYDKFQIRGVSNSRILYFPTPAASGDTVIFEYLAARCVRPPTWTASEAVTSGDYRFYNGNYYTSSTTGTTGATPPTHTSGSVSDGTVTWAYYSGTYDIFLADTDEPVLPQRLLEQGMLERFAEIKGLTVVPRFENQLHEEYSRQIAGRVHYAGEDSSQAFQFARNERVVFGS